MNQFIGVTSYNDHTVQNTLAQLNALLPDHLIRLYPTQRTITLLDKHNLTIIAQQQFTRNEWAIFIAILAAYPHYASSTLASDISEYRLLSNRPNFSSKFPQVGRKSGISYCNGDWRRACAHFTGICVD